MKRAFLILAILIFAPPLPAQTNERVRLALIADSDEASAALDVLTVELSGDKKVELLERNEIQKVYREQGLSALNQDYLKLGRILGADGLLVVHLSKEGDSALLSLRLVAVKPGIALDQHEYPWPLDDPGQWSSLVAAQFRSWFPKLAVLPQDAVPISILNLRSALASAGSEALERELTSLLYNRLVKERDIFVLERRRMELLTEEKELNNATESSFWNGSFLIEGVIDKQGFNPNKLSLDIQLTPRNTKEIVSLAVTGPRTNLPAVINDLALRILAAVKLEGAPTKWDPQAEAERYYAEAKWMFKWHLFQEAKAASEAAWALGQKSREVADLRIRAYEGSAGDPGMCVIQNEIHHVVFGEQFKARHHDPSQIAAFAKAPAPDRFADMVGALELYAEAFRLFVAPGQKPDAAWLNLGVQLVDRASQWLRYHYFTVEARSGQEGRIEEAKRLCREIAGTLAGNPDLAAADTNHAILTIQAEHSAFWMETPEEGLEIYRKLVEAGQWPLVRRRFFNAESFHLSLQGHQYGITRRGISDGMQEYYNGPPGHLANLANPCLAGWKWEDRKRGPAVWSGFIDELCRSSKPLTLLEGRILQCSYSWSEEDFENNLRQLLSLVQEQEEALVAAGLAETLLNDLRTLVEGRKDSLTDARRARIKDEVWADFERQFKEFLKQKERALRDLKDQQKRLTMQDERKNYLETQTNFDFMSFAKILHQADYTPGEANELLPLLTNYAMRISSNNAATTATQLERRRKEVNQKQAKFWIGTLENKLTAVISGLPPRTNAAPLLATAKTPSPAAAVAKPGEAPAPPGAKSPLATAAVKPLSVSRFWQIPIPDDLSTPDTANGGIPSPFQGRASLRQIAWACYRDGKLWTEVRYDQLGIAGRADFFGIDLTTFAAEKISFEDQRFSLPNLISGDRAGAFEVHRGYLYLSLQDSVSRCSLKDGSWNQFPVPATGKIGVARLGDRLFFTTENSILEYNPDGSFRVLASSRRQPAASLLDTVEDYGSPHLFLTADRTLHVCVGNDVYAFSSATNDWIHIATVPNMKTSFYFAWDDGFLASVGSLGGQWWGMLGTLSCPEPLFRKPPRRGQVIAPRLGPQQEKRPTPRWPSSMPSTDVCSEGDQIWFLVDPSESKFGAYAKGQMQPAQQETDQGLSLVGFKVGEEKPIKVPLLLAKDGFTTVRGQPNRPVGPRWNQWILQWTPQGLMATHNGVPGFWLIPKAELDQAVESNYAQRRLEQDALKAQHEKWRQELLAAYDRNHNGVFEPEEKEAMLDDPHFLELSLPDIDANHNGLLDAEELRFFDANTNGVLEPQEQAAIEQTLSLFADKLMATLDPDEEGKIDPADLPAELYIPSPFPQRIGPRLINPLGEYRDGRIGHDEVVDLMQSYLIGSTRVRGNPAIPRRPPFERPRQAMDVKSLFKERVETYWRSSKPLNSSQAAPAKP